jgi:hypothetical protein
MIKKKKGYGGGGKGYADVTFSWPVEHEEQPLMYTNLWPGWSTPQTSHCVFVSFDEIAQASVR